VPERILGPSSASSFTDRPSVLHFGPGPCGISQSRFQLVNGRQTGLKQLFGGYGCFTALLDCVPGAWELFAACSAGTIACTSLTSAPEPSGAAAHYMALQSLDNAASAELLVQHYRPALSVGAIAEAS